MNKETWGGKIADALIIFAIWASIAAIVFGLWELAVKLTNL